MEKCICSLVFAHFLELTNNTSAGHISKTYFKAVLWQKLAIPLLYREKFERVLCCNEMRVLNKHALVLVYQKIP